MDLIINIVVSVLLVHHHTYVHGYSLTNATDSVLGCSHNNTRFANGSFVPTAEPCLNCKCINANLICALRVCPEQVFPPPRGCVIIQKKNSCCPYMSCSAKLHTIYKDQEKNVITHDRKWYEQNIQNRIFSQNALQRKIEDFDDEQQLSNEKMCVYNGTVYRSGSAMTTSSLCTYCYCIEGKQKCIQPKCTLPTRGNCEPILIDSSCCPIRYDCTEKKTIKARYNTKYNRRRSDNKHYLRMTSRMQRSRGCLVNSTFYPEGHKLPANETNPCEICFCIGGSKRCAPKKCAPMIRNCRPIIPPNQCCPSSYDCKTISDHKTARGLTSRQYSDFFSLLFGDEDKENSTASTWDFETETEPINADVNSTNEKGLLDVLKDSLNYVDENKQNIEKQTNVADQTIQSLLNVPSYNVSNDDDGNVGDDDDEDEEEISLLDYFLKGESTFTSTTMKPPFVFNVTGKPLPNGMTNSPMQIQPILSDGMKNGSIKFSMLPTSLYNMVKDDGTVMFDGDRSRETPKIVTSNPLGIVDLKPELIDIESSLSQSSNKSEFVHATAISALKPTTQLPKETTKNHNSSEITTMNIKTTSALTVKPKPIKAVDDQKNITKVHSSTTEKISSTTTTRATTTTAKTSTISTPKTITTIQKPTTITKPMERVTTASPLLPLTTKATTILPKITAIQINSNPSILETDINYDYSEPTLPPSLPNLKIIPFLPTDALNVKNIIHRNDGYKSNYNYYQSATHVDSTAYSPFNVNPTVEKYPSYNVADDRIDYDNYKMPPDNGDGLDYINVYANAGTNLAQPSSFSLSVNSKLDYGTTDQKVFPSKNTPTTNKNLTVKPPLPPFEPEHEYNLYNLPPKPPLELGNNQNEYNVNSPISSDQFPSEHNYNVPHFVTMPPLKESSRKPVRNKDTVFSYGSKNKFIPPAQTEGGFIPKRTSGENYIPLHGSNYHINSNKPIDTESIQNSTDIVSEEESYRIQEKTNPDELNQTANNLDKHIISITTDTNFKSTEEYNEKQSEEYKIAYENEQNSSNVSSKENNISVNSLYGMLFADDEKKVSAPSNTSQTVMSSTITTTQLSVSTQKPPSKNLTNNTIPLKLITILNNTKKDDPTKIEIPQRKNNKIIDPTDEPLVEDMNIFVTTEMPASTKYDSEKNENLTILRNVFLSNLNRAQIVNSGDISEDLLHKSPLFLSRPINKFGITAGFSSLNSLESKHNFQANPIRSELDLIIPELNKNKQINDLSHTNHFSSENYQVLHADDTNIANTESYVVNPVDVDKLKQHQSNSETKIFTPPHKDPAGLLKLAGCNIYGRMYRVGRIITELSSSCLECKCTEVGVECAPLC